MKNDMRGLKAHFSHALARPGAPLHFAAHSHHPWPDATFAAHQQYWHDSARLLDRKWEHIFGVQLPRARAGVARYLGLPDPDTIVFAPNTHELLKRLLSALPLQPAHRILTTDSEFHSFTRQAARLEEDGLVSVTRVPVEPFATFRERFITTMQASDGWDMVWLSHVFFNSGHIVDDASLQAIIAAIPDRQTFAVIDGYHAFMALPLDLSPLAGRIFYVSGSYKYAMAGEGACFMHCPPGYGERPRDTGWYAEFGTLNHPRGKQVGYATDASRFAGATFDPSGIYRLNAVFDWIEGLGLDIAGMQAYCRNLQEHLIASLDRSRLPLGSGNLVISDPARCPRFLTFRTADAGRITAALGSRDIIVDSRADRLRVGFGVYQDEADVDAFLSGLAQVA